MMVGQEWRWVVGDVVDCILSYAKVLDAALGLE
jgi:hypothetical protein